MTLILKLDLDMVKMCLYTKNEVSMWSGSKVIAWTDIHIDRQMDRQTDTTENITYPHSRVVIKFGYSEHPLATSTFTRWKWHSVCWYREANPVLNLIFTPRVFLFIYGNAPAQHIISTLLLEVSTCLVGYRFNNNLIATYSTIRNKNLLYEIRFKIIRNWPIISTHAQFHLWNQTVLFTNLKSVTPVMCLIHHSFNVICCSGILCKWKCYTSPNVHHRFKYLFIGIRNGNTCSFHRPTKGSGERCHWQENKRKRKPSIHRLKFNKEMTTGRWRRFHGYLLHGNSSWSVPLVKPTHESLMLILKNDPSPRPLRTVNNARLISPIFRGQI